MDLVVTPSLAAELAPSALPETLPGAARLGRAVVGFALLGACAALGAEPSSAASIGPSALIVDVGALVLTGPTLLVGHQVLGLEAPVTALAGALGNALCRTGDLALALCPALLWFAATSGLASPVLVLFLIGMAAVGLAHAWAGLRDAELAVGPAGSARVVRDAKMQSLTLAWMGLTALVGLRLGAHLAGL
jgi:hypothetical protein